MNNLERVKSEVENWTILTGADEHLLGIVERALAVVQWGLDMTHDGECPFCLLDDDGQHTGENCPLAWWEEREGNE